MKSSQLSIDDLQRAVQGLPNDALAPARETALAKFRSRGFPTVRDEDWKYTDLSTAIDISNRWLADGAKDESPHALREAISEITDSIDAHWFVIANGIIDDTRVADVAGLDVERFSQSSKSSQINQPLADLNTALLRDGLRLHIHAATERPIAVLVIDDGAGAAALTQAGIDIQIAPGCDAELLEYHASTGDGDHYNNSVCTLAIGEGAAASMVRVQDRALGHVQTSRLAVNMGKDSRFNMAAYDVGGRLIRNDIDIDICEPGSNASFDGLYLAGDGQHIDNHTRVDHRVGPATSSQEYRGILNGKCRCVWNGKAIVHKGADGTDAHQANHNLLLSDKAEIDAKPELEIYADDVKCSHGTTVGQLDESAMFYLRTRGLDRQQASQVLTRAFAEDLVARAPVTAAVERISQVVEAKLAQLIEDADR